MRILHTDHRVRVAGSEATRYDAAPAAAFFPSVSIRKENLT